MLFRVGILLANCLKNYNTIKFRCVKKASAHYFLNICIYISKTDRMYWNTVTNKFRYNLNVSKYLSKMKE